MTEKEELENLIMEVYIYLSDNLDIYIPTLQKHNTFIQEKVIPNFGNTSSECPQELIPEFKPLQQAFIQTIESIQKDFAEMEINRKRLLRLIKFCKAEKNSVKEVLLDMLQCIESFTKDYNYHYHPYKCRDLVTSIMNAQKGFIATCDYIYSREKILEQTK